MGLASREEYLRHLISLPVMLKRLALVKETSLMMSTIPGGMAYICGFPCRTNLESEFLSLTRSPG